MPPSISEGTRACPLLNAGPSVRALPAHAPIAQNIKAPEGPKFPATPPDPTPWWKASAINDGEGFAVAVGKNPLPVRPAPPIFSRPAARRSVIEHPLRDPPNAMANHRGTVQSPPGRYNRATEKREIRKVVRELLLGCWSRSLRRLNCGR